MRGSIYRKEMINAVFKMVHFAALFDQFLFSFNLSWSDAANGRSPVDRALAVELENQGFESLLRHYASWFKQYF